MADGMETLPAKPANLKEARQRGADIAVRQSGAGHMPAFVNMGQVMEYAAAMAGAGAMIRQPLRGNVGACLGIIETASRFGIAPFALASKAYLVNDNIAFEAQAVVSMIYATGQIEGRLKAEYSGEGETRKVTIRGKIKGEPEILEYTSPEKRNIKTQNSPLWKSDVDQQLFYLGSRSWCRRHAPDLLLGVYDIDEMQDAEPRNITPKNEIADPAARLQARLDQAKPQDASGAEMAPTDDLEQETAPTGQEIVSDAEIVETVEGEIVSDGPAGGPVAEPKSVADEPQGDLLGGEDAQTEAIKKDPPVNDAQDPETAKQEVEEKPATDAQSLPNLPAIDDPKMAHDNALRMWSQGAIHYVNKLPGAELSKFWASAYAIVEELAERMPSEAETLNDAFDKRLES